MRIDKILAAKQPTFSVEFFPPKTEEATEQLFVTALALRGLEPDFVSVTYGAGGSTREGTVEITRRLKDELGFETMAHLSCVGETVEGLAATLDRIDAAGIENVFSLRGDPPRGQKDFVQPEGGLGSAAELAAFITSRWDFAIGGACFPEVHPEAPDLDTDLAYLKTKVEAGASFLITQLFFDNQVYFDFVAAARERGIDVPILAGVIPVASFAQTKRICELCDASIPPRLEEAFAAAEGDEQAEFELGVAFAAQQCAELLIAGAPGIHFYALNRAPATRAVLSALRAARPWERVREPVADGAAGSGSGVPG
jgi:methylenetetrahydrofolate reductase (NADPH)